MINNPIFKRFKKIAIDGDYTVAQISNTSNDVIREKLGVTYLGKTYGLPLSETFLSNMKHTLILWLKDRDDEADKQFLINQLEGGMRDAFRNRFPDAVIEKTREQGKRKVTMWIDGKPEGG